MALSARPDWRTTAPTRDWSDPLTFKTLSRVVALAQSDAVARAELLARAIAELVGASWLELAHRPELSSSTERAAAKAQRDLARDAIRERENDWRWSTGLGPGVFFASLDPVAVWGPALQLLARSPSDLLHLQFDMFGGYGSHEHRLGTVSASLWSSSALLLFDITVPRILSVQLGAGARFGATRIANEAAAGQPAANTRDVSGMFGGLSLALGVSHDFSRWGSLRLMNQQYMGSAVLMRQDGEVLQAIGGISHLWTLTLHLAM